MSESMFTRSFFRWQQSGRPTTTTVTRCNWRPYPSTLQVSLPKKGQRYRIRRVQAHCRHKETACCSWFCRVSGGSDHRTCKQARVHAAHRCHRGCHEEHYRQRRRHIEDISSARRHRLYYMEIISHHHQYPPPSI